MPARTSGDLASSPRFALRSLTAGAHGRLDTLYSALDLSDAGDYGRFLIAHAAALLPVEDALAAAGADDLVAGWSRRRRGAALYADLAALGLSLPPVRARPEFVTEAALLGGLYVLEGSRLGGAVLIGSVAPGLPTGFLKPDAGFAWRDFTDLLNARLSSADALERAAASANHVFAVFEDCARATLEAAPLAE